MRGSVRPLRVVLAEFEGPSQLLEAARKVREAGYTKFDCHSPYPVHGMSKAMGVRRSSLGWIAGILALLGVTGGITLQWWTSSVAYPLVISGKPFFSYQAYVPVTFALGVLMAGLAALFGMLALNKLPRLNHPVFSSERFQKVSDDRFFVSIESHEPLFEIEKARRFLESIGGSNIEVVGE